MSNASLKDIRINQAKYTKFISSRKYDFWGKATFNGKTFQLRAFDWDIDAGLQDYPAITIYHPGSLTLCHPFTNVALVGNFFTLVYSLVCPQQ